MKRHWWLLEDLPRYARDVERCIQREVDKDLYFCRNLNLGGRYELWHRPPRTKPYMVQRLVTPEGKMLIPGDNLGADWLKRKLQEADLSNRQVRESFDKVVDHNIANYDKLQAKEDDDISQLVKEDLDMLMEKPRQFVPDSLGGKV
jgi:hypothetical protein